MHHTIDDQAADDAWADPAWPVNSDYCAHCNTIGNHRTQHCPAATGPTLPTGAEYATEYDDELGTRVVFSPDYCPGRPGVCASAVQTNSGVIVDDPAEEAPAVHVAVPDSGQLTYQEARALAAALQQAAGQAEAWAVEAAKQRHPSIVGRRAEGVR